jgi:hypothetical protein
MAVQLADAMAGQNLNSRGFFEPLTKDSTEMRKDIKDKLEHESADYDWAIAEDGSWEIVRHGQSRPFPKLQRPNNVENRTRQQRSELR